MATFIWYNNARTVLPDSGIIIFLIFSVDANDVPVCVITLVPAHDLFIYLFIFDPRGLAIAAARDTETPMEVIAMQVIPTIDAVC